MEGTYWYRWKEEQDQGLILVALHNLQVIATILHLFMQQVDIDNK